METRAHFVLIGAFTLAVIAGAFLFVLWFSGLTRIAEHKSYEILFTGSVSGLSRGGAVLFNGLRVGEVREINLDPNDPGRVQALVDVSGSVPIKKDTTARLEIQGLTGGAVIALNGGAPDAPPLIENKGAPPIIIAEPSQLQDLMENVRSLSAKAESVLGKADKLISDNSVAVGDAITNLDAFSKALGDNAPGIKSAVADLESLLKSIDGRKVANFLDGADSLGQTLRDNKGEIDRTLKNVSEFAVGVNRFSSSGLREYEALAVDGRRTINDLDRVVRGFERNPSEIIFGAKPTLPQLHGGP